MTPDADGVFRGIVVGRLWPGHRDYEPPAEITREKRGDVWIVLDPTCPPGNVYSDGSQICAHPSQRRLAEKVADDRLGRSCGVEVDAIPCFSGCACTCGTDCPCECHPNNKEGNE